MNDELLIRFLLKETSAEEDLLVNNWLDASTENRKHLLQFETIWNSSKNLASVSTANADKAWLKFKARASADSAVIKSIKKPALQGLRWLQIAALLCIAMAGAWSVYSYLKTGYTTISTNQLVQTETLPDGSEVTLNKNSVLYYPKTFAGDKRNVKLQKGEAFFNVTADKAKPFIIHAGHVQVRVVGTSFNVKYKPQATVVIVETGIVEVSSNNERVLLKPGEQVHVAAGSKLVKQKSTDILYNYYRSKEFVADNTPLWRVTEVLNEAYGANIIIADERLKNLTLTTTFKDQPLDNILRVISQTFDIKVEKTANQVILKPLK